MTLLASNVADRRRAPRLRMSFAAELASGTVLAPVVVQDLSVKGCGIAIQGDDTDLPDEVGGNGLLHLPTLQSGTPGALLPFVLRNVRTEGERVVYGLEFRTLLSHQTERLVGVMEAIVREEAEKAP